MDDEAFEARASSAKRQAVASVELTAKERAIEKQERRADRETELSKAQLAPPDPAPA
jgi:hypothetical protein